jgi:hypothetical protein
MQDLKHLKRASSKKTSLREKLLIVAFFVAFASVMLGAGLGGEWLQHHRAGYTESRY